MQNSKRRLSVLAAVVCAMMLTVFVTGSAQAPISLSINTGIVFGDPTPESSGFTPSTTHPYADIKSAIDSHAAVNSDVRGWLMVPGTNMNYPVLYSSANNSYYEYRDWRGTHYPNTNYLNYTTTAIYLDYRTRFGTTWQNSSRNFVLYGHNWNNLRDPMVIGNRTGYTMFAQLPSYTDLTFSQTNPHIYFSTGENEGVWRVFAVAYCELSADFFYNNPNPDSVSHLATINEWRARSLLNFDVDVNADDTIVTLTTCTRRYDVGGYQRYSVVARLLRDGESENDAVNVTVNNTVKEPNFSNIRNTTLTGAMIAAESTASAAETVSTDDSSSSTAAAA